MTPETAEDVLRTYLRDVMQPHESVTAERLLDDLLNAQREAARKRLHVIELREPRS